MTEPVLILVIDDMDSNLFMLSTMLKREGFCVAVAASGPEGRKLAAEKQPDLILLDIVMPGENGFLTCDLLRKEPATASIPIVFLSALEDTESKIKGLSAGAADFVSKPFMKEEILVRIRSQILLRRNRCLVAENFAARLASPEASGEEPETTSLTMRIAEGINSFFCARAAVPTTEGARALRSLDYLLPRVGTPLLAPEEAMGMVCRVLHQIVPSVPVLSAAYCVFNRNASRFSVILSGDATALLADASGSVFYCGSPGESLASGEAPYLRRMDYTTKPGARFCAVLAKFVGTDLQDSFRRLFLDSIKSPAEDQRPALAAFLAERAGIDAASLFLFDAV